MKTMVIVLVCFLLTGCAAKDYQIYVEAQKSINRDFTMTETARIAALTEMSKSDDPAVRATSIMLLQQLQAGSKHVVIEPPRKSFLGL